MTLVVLSLFIYQPHFTIRNTITNELLFITEFQDGESFLISYIHSLHQTPIIEEYKRYNGELVLVSVEFESLGAGLPDILEYGQTLTHLETGGMRVDGLHRTISDLHILIGHNTYHTLHIADQHFLLESLDNPGQSLHLAFRQLNLWQRLYYGILLR
jgi:hypothetical protein